MQKKNKPTIYDIAVEAQVSPSTVAAILNGSWKKRRVSAETAKAVQEIATQRGYSINLQARGLRHSRSGLIGMIVPMLDNRFFSSLAQAFEEMARAQGLYPVVVSTLRQPANEHATVKALISHNVEALFLAGATDPDGLSELCGTASIPHINIDLPGRKALSVISDNYQGAYDVTGVIAREVLKRSSTPQVFFIGGIGSDYNTHQRIDGFRQALTGAGCAVSDERVRPAGYEAAIAEATIRDIHAQLGRLPDGLFVNSTIAFEGVVRFLRTLPHDAVLDCTIGCFDWDPYIELLNFPVIMARQDVRAMIRNGYELIEEANAKPTRIVLIPTELIVPDGFAPPVRIKAPLRPSGPDKPFDRHKAV